MLFMKFEIDVYMQQNINPRNPKVFPGADETTPSHPQYFTWINNTNEGATEEQTLINLEFFEWLYREYGMILEIYAFDAGAIDGPRNYYGTLDSDKFKRQFPNAWDKIYVKAKSIGCRLGVWGGPDGFGENEEDAQKRIDLISKLCKDYELALLKFDGVCGQLRPNKQDYFIKMMKEARKHSPDLILLNHRLPLYRGLPYATTELMEGIETYVDVHQYNKITGTHNRIENLSRKVPPMMARLQEDHGVCLSSCLDFWDDDLILQAFNRGLILAPEIYGNPWFLRDDEYPKLARIYNLHYRNREILVSGFILNEYKYGPQAVTRGDPEGLNAFLTLRNLTWEPKLYKISLNGEIGLAPTDNKILVRKFHPYEKIYGVFSYNDTVEIEVHAFRSCLITASQDIKQSEWDINDEIGVEGCEYEILKDLPDQPVNMKLYGMPGSSAMIKLHSPKREFSSASIDGNTIDFEQLESGKLFIEFPGTPLKEQWHRKIADLDEIKVPENAEQLYETTIFEASNNCLEERCIIRSGPTKIPQVQAARDAFFNQPFYKVKGVEYQFAFDGNDSTRWYTPAVAGSALRIDMGEILDVEEGDTFIIKGSEDEFYDIENFSLDISSDLMNWKTIFTKINDCLTGNIPSSDEKIYYETPEDPINPFNAENDPRFFGEKRYPFPVGKQKFVEFKLPKTKIRYVRLAKTPLWVLDANIKTDGKLLKNREKWRGNYMFGTTQNRPVNQTWKCNFSLSEIPPKSYLCVAINGEHGLEGAYATLSIDDGKKLIGSSLRAPSYPGHPWEANLAGTNKNYTYYFPLTERMIGKSIDIYVLKNSPFSNQIKPELWITAHPTPYKEKILELQ
jgi:hypothetical protein